MRGRVSAGPGDNSPGESNQTELELLKVQFRNLNNELREANDKIGKLNDLLKTRDQEIAELMSQVSGLHTALERAQQIKDLTSIPADYKNSLIQALEEERAQRRWEAEQNTLLQKRATETVELMRQIYEEKLQLVTQRQREAETMLQNVLAERDRLLNKARARYEGLKSEYAALEGKLLRHR